MPIKCLEGASRQSEQEKRVKVVRQQLPSVHCVREKRRAQGDTGEDVAAAVRSSAAC